MDIQERVHVYKICALSQTVTLLDKIQTNIVTAKRRALYQKYQVEMLIHCTQWPRAATGVLQPVVQPHPMGTTAHAGRSQDELWYHREDENWREVMLKDAYRKAGCHSSSAASDMVRFN